jgi:hypothetical protein
VPPSLEIEFAPSLPVKTSSVPEFSLDSFSTSERKASRPRGPSSVTPSSVIGPAAASESVPRRR